MGSLARAEDGICWASLMDGNVKHLVRGIRYKRIVKVVIVASVNHLVVNSIDATVISVSK